MIVLGIVQSGLALSTISPTLSEQFGELVNLAVVTNVIPYIIALSALPVMMQAAKRPGVDISAQRGGGPGGDALQHLRPLRFGQGCGARGHAGHRDRLHDLGLYCAALHASGSKLRPKSPKRLNADDPIKGDLTCNAHDWIARTGIVFGSRSSLMASLAAAVLQIRLGSASIGGNPGPGTANGQADTWLSDRCAAIFLSGRVR